MALAVGIAFATNTRLAALAYRGGATPLAVLLARACTAFVLLNLLMSTRGVPRILPAPRRSGAILIGCIFAGYSYGVLAAIQDLSVGLVVATFYTFSILFGLVERWSQRQPFSARSRFNAPTARALALGAQPSASRSKAARDARR